MSLAYKAFKNVVRLSSLIAPTATASVFTNAMFTPRCFPVKEWEQEIERSANRFQITERISALSWAPAPTVANGQVALLAHGWESRATQMYEFAPALLAKGFEVIALDMPAHGKSPGKSSDILQFANAIAAAEKHVEEKNSRLGIVIGHSMGAAATTLAVSRGVKPGSIVLVSSPSHMSNILGRFARFAGLADKATETFLSNIEKRVGISPYDVDSTIFLRDFSGPLLVIHDEDDKEVPITEAKRLLQSKPETQSFITRGLGHRKILRSPEIIEQIALFLENNTADQTYSLSA